MRLPSRPLKHAFRRGGGLAPVETSSDAERPTAWLGMQDSNSEMSWQIIPLKDRADVRGVQPNSGQRDYSRLSCGVEIRSSASRARRCSRVSLLNCCQVRVSQAWSLALPTRSSISAEDAGQ